MSTPTTIIIPDVHGNLDMAAGLLRQAGALNDAWERIARDEIRTVQLGDLCNCVGRSVVDDNRCLDHVREWFDVCLVGNHEHPYFGGPRFSGFWRDQALEVRLRGLKASGHLRAALAVDGILVTHAGLGPEWDLVDDSAEAAADWLNEVWDDVDPAAPVLSQIGCLRGGAASNGGILWADWSEPKATSLRQIVGHTVGLDVRHVSFSEGGWAICLDLGGGKHSARLAGALVREGDVEILIYDRAAEAVA